MQVGIRVDGAVWDAYKSVCVREELRPNEGVEGFLRVVLEDSSALGVLRMLQRALRVRVESLDDYAQVLLNWYKGGRRWVYSEGREVSVDAMLLFVLREVSDSQLRRKIRKTLTAKGDGRRGKPQNTEESEGKEEEDSEELESTEPMPSSVAERIKDIRKQAVGLELNAEEKQKILKKIRDIRESMKRR
jgi:hypothetical protein